MGQDSVACLMASFNYAISQMFCFRKKGWIPMRRRFLSALGLNAGWVS